ncbi:hypothetical protein M9Y10_022826 [Tritrichomonas musculus]|uniref:Ankyrin repeat protein n=1 Tax=Tritrichomonas musculus TaxID=1915356 RepID=A0ABR2KUD2_9EUKA
MSLISIVKNQDIVSLSTKTITKKELNEQDEHGNTALHYAMASGNWYVIKILLNEKPDIQIENKEGLTALQMAKPDSIRRMCVETQLRSTIGEKTESFLRKDASPDEVAEKMGFSSNTCRLKDGIETHSQIITGRLAKTKNRLSKILINACNYQGCANNADCIFSPCGHIVYCFEHGAEFNECPKCHGNVTEKYQILPNT